MHRRFFRTVKGGDSEIVVGVKISGSEPHRIISEDYPMHFIAVISIPNLPLKIGWKETSQRYSSDNHYIEKSFANGLHIASVYYGTRHEYEIVADADFQHVRAINFVEYQKDKNDKVIETERVSCAPLMM